MSTIPDSPGELNRASYDRIAARWDAARAGFFSREPVYLDALLEGLERGSRVLDLGCGSGRPMGEAVIARGHRLLGVDQSAALLEIARSRLPDAQLVLCAIEDYAFDQPVEAVILWDSLFHIERRRHEPILARACSVLPEGGRLMLTAGGSAHDAFTDSMFGETFFYDSHPPEALLELLGRLGLEPLIAEFLNPPDGGRDRGRYAVVARKPGLRKSRPPQS